MAERREIARCTTYDELQKALRAWADEIGMSREMIDERSGLGSGYSSHVLAAYPTRRLAAVTLPLMLGALGCHLVLAADESDLQKIMRTVVKRDQKKVRARLVSKGIKVIVIDEFLKQRASAGGRAYREKTTAAQRQWIARKAAAARWGYRFRG